MNARQRKKLRLKTDRYIAYRQAFGLPVILDESAKFSKKGRRLMRAQAFYHRLLGTGPNVSVISTPHQENSWIGDSHAEDAMRYGLVGLRMS